MKKIVFLIGMVVLFNTAKAQYVTDALKYSQTFPAITARSLGMGGAFTSLGGDFSSVLNNPAGLGLYRKSEFVITPALNYSSTNAKYLGLKNDDFRYQFNLGSLGYVGTFLSNKDKGLVSSSFALGYVRQNSYNNNTLIRGTNADNSLTDYFQQNAEEKDPENLDAFYERLAFDAFIIDTIPGTPFNYQANVPLPTDQRKTIETNGGIGEWTFAVGLNFSNIFYVGMGLGVHQLQYDRTSVHTELDSDPNHDFSRFRFNEELNVDGTGFNMNLGIMLRLMEVMRIGGSMQLPTYYKIRESYYNTIYSQFKNGDEYAVVPTDINGDQLSEGNFKYKLNTPLKLQGGLSVQIGKMGIVSADLEFVDYANMRLRESDNITDFGQSNDDIKTIYKSTVNLKLGGEVRFDNLTVRVGGGYYPSPVSSMGSPAVYDYISTVPDSYGELTTGIGYRTNNFFFDLGFSRLAHSEKYNLYFENVANLSQVQYRLLATLGFRF